MKMILNRIALGVILLVVVLFSVDKSILGHGYIGLISFVCFLLIINYISTLEKKDQIDKKVKIIGWFCFFGTVIIGLLLIISFPEIFNTYGL
ncbi:hypothetical protein D8M04_07980 [Oceanobacillus piezotolerans]|uniref:Uncharacterized protein n=1 Tax=Oceanobacillus piezotolerans TaxID=2448030 RepID=A0A498D9M3_9BACI|nr:hypothetical protein [Oceanobacillus piezotolerans]RLL47113.1 hypothetical protein D8M04_07980 [Oceanobacillus piezotolerans]